MTTSITSLESYNKIYENLPKSEFRVFQCIKFHGPLTNKEISIHINKEINCVTGRTRSLVNKGVVRSAGTKIVNGFTQKLWEIVRPEVLF